VALAKGGVNLLNQLDLLVAQRDGLCSSLLLELEQALVACAKTLLVEDVLHRRERDGHTGEREMVADAIAAPGRLLQCQRDDLLDDLVGRGLGMCFGEGGRSLRPSKPCTWKRRLYS